MILDDLTWRYATKLFDPSKKVGKKDLEELQEVLRLSPSSFGLEPWKFLVITDASLKAKIREHAWGQSQVTDCSHLFILCTRTDVDEIYIKNHIKKIASIRNVDSASLSAYEQLMIGFRKRMTEAETITWAKKQVYIASGFFMLACAHKHIDTCPMEGFDPKKVDEVLGLSAKKLTATLLLPIGYRSTDDKYAHAKKVRFDSSEVFVYY